MTATLKEAFVDKGFLLINEFFTADSIEIFETAVIDLFAMQARKIGEYREAVDDIMASGDSRYDKIVSLVEMLEENDKEAAYQVQKFLPKSQACRAMFDEGFVKLIAELIDANPATTLIDGPALFVNNPVTERLLYKWHTEALYYPKRRRFMNVWLPMFSERTQENGAMSIMPGSHKRVYDASMMSEYVGYNKDTENKKNHFVQYEIPQNFLDGYEVAHCECKPGDMVLFDRNLVHTSNANTSNDTSFAVVLRVWSPEDDLTLSGAMEATPYGGNTGRANLVVRP